jgi:hypothetical protein
LDDGEGEFVGQTVVDAAEYCRSHDDLGFKGWTFMLNALTVASRGLVVKWWGGTFHVGKGLLGPPMAFAASIHLRQQTPWYVLRLRTIGNRILVTLIG